MARNRACITDRLANRYYVSHSHHPKLDDLRGMLWSTGWETGGRVHLVGTIIGRITGAYLTRYPNPRTSNPSRRPNKSRANGTTRRWRASNNLECSTSFLGYSARLFPLIKSGSSPLLLFPQSNEPGDAHFRLGYDQQRPAPSPPCNLIAATRRSAWPRFGDEMRVRMETKTFPSSSSNENSSFATRWPDRLLARRAVFRRLMHLTSG